MNDSPQTMRIVVQRDSVSMADDIQAPHSDDFEIPVERSLKDFFDQICFDRYLPGIMTGEATWVLENAVGQVLAIYAQQWSDLVFLVDTSLPIGHYFQYQHVNYGYSLFFRYHQQTDPALLLQGLRMKYK